MNDAIEANQARIQAPQVSVSALNSSVEDIIGDIAALELRVANNSNDVRALFGLSWTHCAADCGAALSSTAAVMRS